jgi:DNA-binding response OmpR family regulator
MKHILIVEDDEELCKGYGDFLSDDYILFCAHNGRDALEIFGKEIIDLVILDLIMPDMNGIETLRKIKEIRNNIKVIILTGLRYKSVEEQLKSLGAHTFLAKPIFGKDLLAEVNKLLA